MISGLAPLTIHFTDTTPSANETVSRVWDFGDGSATSIEENPQHTFTTEGIYAVSLSVSNGISSSIYTDYVLVIPLVPATSYWSLDEDSGTRVDQVGGHDLTPSGAPTATPAILDNGVLFAEATSDLLSVAHTPDLEGGDVDLSIAFWFRPTANSPTSDQYVLIGIEDEWKVYISGFTGPQNNYIRFGWWDSAGTFGTTFGPEVLFDNQWRFVCAWRDRTEQTINIQVDGGTVFSNTSTNGGQIAAVAFGLGGYWNSSKIVNGVIDEAYVYRGLWTDEEKALLASIPPEITQQSSDRAAQIMLDISNDGGKTWIAQPWRSIGGAGQWAKRVRWNRLGAARRRVFQVSVTDPVPWKLTGAYLDDPNGGSGGR